MRDDDVRADLLMKTLSDLPMYDVDNVRARRLRTRCRASLIRQAAPGVPRAERIHTRWRHPLGVMLVAFWSAMYLAATLRQAAAIFGL